MVSPIPSKQASKQANIHTHGCNEVMLLWGSLRLAPFMAIWDLVQLLPKHAPIELREYHHYSRSHNLTLKVPFAKTNTFYYSSSVTPFAIGMLYLQTLLTL